LPAETIYPFYEELHCATFKSDQGATYRLLHEALEKPFAILCVLRRAARAGFYDPGDFSEYYQGLMLYLLGALKFRNLDEIPGAKQIAFWGAATLQHLLQAASPIPAHNDTHPDAN
jgi:hypothetical protein